MGKSLLQLLVEEAPVEAFEEQLREAGGHGVAPEELARLQSEVLQALQVRSVLADRRRREAGSSAGGGSARRGPRRPRGAAGLPGRGGDLMLSVTGLHGYYGASHVLQGVDLDAGPGELVALLGRNGAGKTTTLGALMGVVAAPRGSVVVDDRELAGMASHERLRHGLALVPSGARVFPNLTVEENLAVVRPRPGDGKRWTVGAVYDLFPKLGHLRAGMAGSLSGGERQMLAVGRGLMANPRVLLLDEPSEGLAPVVVQAIGSLLDDLKSTGLAVVLAEQNHRFALRHADRAFLIEKGAIGHRGPAEALVDSPELHRYLGV